jgi:methionine biosynthesis protein MetW
MSRVQEFYEKRGVYGVAPNHERVRNYICVRNRLRKTLELIQAQHPRKVLDLGCGDGFFSQRIQEAMGASVCGVDISLEATEKARERGIDARQCDLNEGICFEAESFDLVFCGEVIEHVFDPDFLLDEIGRVLVPAGNLILSTPNLAAWYNRILLLLGVQPIFTDTSTRKTLGRHLALLGQGSQPIGHLRVYTLAALRDILREHHFTIRRVRALPFLPFPVLHQIDKLIGLIPSLGSDFLVLARKSQ